MTRIVIAFSLLFFSLGLQAKSNDFEMFNTLFSKWTFAFNHQDLKKSCELFSKKVIADYRGVPTKNYDAICTGFKTIFHQKNQRYVYRYRLHPIYHEGDLAAVRITWYLTYYKNNRLVSSTQDEGMDILEKNKNNEWKIVNYLAYQKE